jgi:limonene-1,2-epoxide hydrolase
MNAKQLQAERQFCDPKENVMESEAENIVNEFYKVISRKNLDELLTYFSDDPVFQPMMMEPTKGKAAIRAALASFTDTAESVQFKLLASATVGNRVMNERAETLVTRAGKKAEVPAAGFFEIKEGKIFAWRDYFDLQTFTKQME